jgi:hypothetical protein
VGCLAHRTTLQQDATGDTIPADQGSSSDQKQKDQKSQKPQLSGTRKGFKKSGKAKQFLQEIGPEAAEQILLNAGYLNQPTLEEATQSLENLLTNNDDAVSLQLLLLLLLLLLL